MQCIMQCILCYYSKCCDKISCNPHSREWFSWFTQMNDSNDAAVKFQREIHTAIRLGPIPHHEDLDDLLVGQCFHLSVTMDSPRHQGLVRHQHQLPGLWMISIRHEFHVSKFASNNSSLASFTMPNATEPDALMELFLSALKPVNDCELLFSFIPHPSTSQDSQDSQDSLPWAVRRECPTVQCQVGLWHHCPTRRPSSFKTCHVWYYLTTYLDFIILYR